MKSIVQRLLLLAAATCPVHAIEPPVESQPIPPSAPPAAVLKAPSAPPRAAVVPEARVQRPYIGVILEPVPAILGDHLKLSSGEGVVIGELVAGGPAESSGLQVHDVIIRINGRSVGSPEQVREEVEAHQAGDEVKIAFIHQGETRELALKLGAAPDMPPLGAVPGDVSDIAGLEQMLRHLPDRHADRILDEIRRNIREFESLQGQADLSDQLQNDLLQRFERRFGGAAAGAATESESTIRLMDEQGSIEMKCLDGEREARILDPSGAVLWEGPYNSEQDKEAVPQELRGRLDKLDLDFDPNLNGLRIKPNNQRFRPLDEVAPKLEE